MAMLDTTDIDFKTTPAQMFARRIQRRLVTRADMVFNTLAVVMWVGVLVYEIGKYTSSGMSPYIFLLFWLLVAYPIYRDYMKLYRSYRNGEKTLMSGHWKVSGWLERRL